MTEPTPPLPAETRSAPQRSRLTRLYVGAICLLALLVSTAQIFDECAISLDGDMPRHLMNGAFLRDMVADGGIGSPREYMFRYFAQYPALSIGLHPPLLPAAEAAAFSALGVSVLAARWTIVGFLLVGALAWFAIARREAGDLVALLSTSLLVTTPIVSSYSRLVMTEIPALSLVILAAWLLQRYCDAPSGRRAAAFAIAFVASLYAKQLAILLAPVFATYAVWRLGPRVVVRREVIVASVVGVFALVPLAFLTWEMSKVNVDLVRANLQHEVLRPGVAEHFRSVIGGQLTPPAAILAVAGLVVAVWRRSALIFVGWSVIVFVELRYLTGQIQPARYGIYLVPAFCFYAAYVVRAAGRRRFARAVLALLVAVVVAQQFLSAMRHDVPRACGYEHAARFVVDAGRGDTVLFSGLLDTGYFVFFVRKHDPDRQLVVLRADKLLTTSRMNQVSIDEHVTTPAQLYELLRELGTVFVVLEDVHMPSPALEMLHEEVKTGPFEERLRLKAGAGDDRIEAVEIAVYEYRGAEPAAADARVRMTMPLAGQSIDLPLRAVRHGGEAQR